MAWFLVLASGCGSNHSPSSRTSCGYRRQDCCRSCRVDNSWRTVNVVVRWYVAHTCRDSNWYISNLTEFPALPQLYDTIQWLDAVFGFGLMFINASNNKSLTYPLLPSRRNKGSPTDVTTQPTKVMVMPNSQWSWASTKYIHADADLFKYELHKDPHCRYSTP